MKDGQQTNQSLFSKFAVPDWKIPRAKHELDQERKEALLRHLTISNAASYYRRKKELALRRRSAKQDSTKETAN